MNNKNHKPYVYKTRTGRPAGSGYSYVGKVYSGWKVIRKVGKLSKKDRIDFWELLSPDKKMKVIIRQDRLETWKGTRLDCCKRKIVVKNNHGA